MALLTQIQEHTTSLPEILLPPSSDGHLFIFLKRQTNQQLWLKLTLQLWETWRNPTRPYHGKNGWGNKNIQPESPVAGSGSTEALCLQLADAHNLRGPWHPPTTRTPAAEPSHRTSVRTTQHNHQTSKKKMSQRKTISKQDIQTNIQTSTPSALIPDEPPYVAWDPPTLSTKGLRVG